MFKEIKEQYLKEQEDLKRIKSEKKAVKEFLEERRKKDEEMYLNEILIQAEENKKSLESKKKVLLRELSQELEEFSKMPKKEKASELLEALVFASSIDKKMPESLKKVSKSLYDYFLAEGDIDSAVTFLKARCGSLFKEDELVSRREEYIRYLEVNPNPEVEKNSRYIIGYGEYVEDIVRLFEVCGRLDRESAPKDFKGIYYSEKTALLLVMGALDEFGDVLQHLYYVPPFGTQDCDRETLMCHHNKGYMENESDKQLIEGAIKEI